MPCRQARRDNACDGSKSSGLEILKFNVTMRAVVDDKSPDMENAMEPPYNSRLRRGRSDRSGPLRNVAGISGSWYSGKERERLSSAGK
jgi:hypothetical protein